MTKRILLTGGLGFIGSHTVEHYLEKTDWHIMVLDGLRKTGKVERLLGMDNFDPKRIEVFFHDMAKPFTDSLIEKIGHVDYIVNMASDSHVDRSINTPVDFVQNNVQLQLNILTYALKVKPQTFIQVSTDEVFGPAAEGVSHKEDDQLRPSNPYSASKAAQELLSFSYWRSYGLPLITTNTMNNFGERQDIEKFVPMSVRKILNDEVNQIHSKKENGKWVSGTRIWLHARNHADAIMFIIKNLKAKKYSADTPKPLRFNVAGDQEISNEEIVNLIGRILGKKVKSEHVDFNELRPGHDLRYSLDRSLLKEAGWEMPYSTEMSFEKTINWIKKHPKWFNLPNPDGKFNPYHKNKSGE